MLIDELCVLGYGFEYITVNDAKTLLLTYESRLERGKEVSVSPLPSVNLSIKKK